MFSVARLNVSNSSSHLHSGGLSLVITLVIWSFYFVALRSGAQSQLTSYDMALLRFVLPALVLLPILLKARTKILAVPKRYLLGIVAGAGLPFYLLSVIASSQVQAVIGSLLIPGVAPVFVTMIAVVFFSERLSKRRFTGLLAVTVGVAVLVVNELNQTDQQLLGPLLYLGAAALWAVYTISVKVAKLSGLEVAAILNVSAALILLACLPMDGFESNLMQVPLAEILPQLLIMGVFCGVISVVTYGNAIQKLGAELAACWGAMTPVFVAFLAYFLLEEQLDINTLAAMVLISLGVICANFKKPAKR
ncbi:MAG: DMT family transporter [Oceanospirillaceae bacterium]|nr:DMT family transporter [Oceanospirillaceae bacterium]